MKNESVGIGFRRELASDLINLSEDKPDFIEFAPENWMGLGGYWKEQLDLAASKYPILCHGLSLSIGSPDDIDVDFVHDLREFLETYNVEIYSEHLSYSKCSNAHLYDLLPIPFRQDAVDHIVDRIKKVQDILGMPIALENVSYYTPVAAQMPEEEFISSIIDGSGCNLLLDVNNVFVNAHNHNYQAKRFIENLPLDRVVYIHMAGHEKIQDDLLIDTHGRPIIDPVYDLFEWTLDKIKPVPILLERDFNIPELTELQTEMQNLRSIVNKKWSPSHVA